MNADQWDKVIGVVSVIGLIIFWVIVMTGGV